MRFTPAHPLSIYLEPQTRAGENNRTSFDIESLLPGYRHIQAGGQNGDFLIVPEPSTSLLPARRLLALVPDGDFNENEFAHRIWQLASTASLHILFVALSTNLEDTAYLHRRLTTMAALTAFGEVKTAIIIKTEKDCLLAIHHIMKPGDLLVCLSEHQVPFWIIGRRVLGEYLSTSLNTPVYLIGNLQLHDSNFGFSRLKGAISWIASFAIIIAFALVQIWINQATADPASTILLCISVIFELLLILKANEWVG
jgi:hypothetical protein